MTQLTVEVGQTYRDALGRKCGPMAKIMTPKGKALFYPEGQDPACSWVDKSGQCVEPERCLVAPWFKITEGVLGKTAYGRTVGPMIRNNDGTFRADGEFAMRAGKRDVTSAQCWLDDGSIVAQQPGEEIDAIIALWTEEPAGPVRTRTVTEIVEGVYGPLELRKSHMERNVAVRFNYREGGSDSDGFKHLDYAELTAAIATLTAVRDALEAQS